MRASASGVDVLDREAIRAEVDSPTYLGALWSRTGAALVHPGKLADGLRRAAVAAGVRICEYSPVSALEPDGAGIKVTTDAGVVRARRRAARHERPPAAADSDPSLHRADLRLRADDRAAVRRAAPRDRLGPPAGDRRPRQPVSLLPPDRDHRILFGGYDAVYRYGGPVEHRLEDHPPTFATLSQHFFTTFPALEGLRFSHRWGGAIDTCSRFSVFFGRALDGRVAYAAGYTGLGRRGQPLRGAGRAGSAGRRRHSGDPAAVRAPASAAVPARAAALGRHPADPQPTRRRRRTAGAAGAVARDAGPARASASTANPRYRAGTSTWSRSAHSSSGSMPNTASSIPACRSPSRGVALGHGGDRQLAAAARRRSRPSRSAPRRSPRRRRGPSRRRRSCGRGRSGCSRRTPWPGSRSLRHQTVVGIVRDPALHLAGERQRRPPHVGEAVLGGDPDVDVDPRAA